MKKVGDFSVCKLEADSFLETAMWCSENVDNLLCGQMYPFAVNISLSCELYLKAIMIQSSSNCEFESGHDLKYLFDHISNDKQKTIASLYSQKCSKCLEELFKESALAFNSWRYAMESGDSICVDGMIAFAESLKNCVEQK